MNLIEYILTAILCAISAHVYLNILIKPSMILGPFAKFMNVYFGPLRKKGEIKWIFKPVIGCDYCVTGQFALWTFLFKTPLENYDILNHIGFICLAIFVVELIKTMQNGRIEET